MTVQAFKDSLLFSLFPNLNSPVGDELLNSVYDYVMTHLDGNYISKHCPKKLDSYVIHAMAYIISSWGYELSIDAQGNSSYSISKTASDAKLYLKRKTTGSETCEFAEVSACNDCSAGALDKYKTVFESIADNCKRLSVTPFMGGGSNYRCKYKNTGCCGAK